MATFDESRKEAVYKLALACMEGLDIETAHRITSLMYLLPSDEKEIEEPPNQFWEGNPRPRKGY